MVLIKCKCGCFYTLKGESLERDADRKCPNCGIEHKLGSYGSIRAIEADLDPETSAIRIIPDDAKIRISFEA